MIDFTQMECGVISHKQGLIIVMNGKFHGPLNESQVDRLLNLIEGEDK